MELEKPEKNEYNNYQIELQDRIKILIKAYSIITKNFSNWDPIINLNVDDLFDIVIREVIETESRKEFMFLIKKLIAKLNNGHSGYIDNVITQLSGYLDFQFGFFNEKWIISKSLNQNLLRGVEITHINDVPINDFYDSKKIYISASSEYERKSKFGTDLHEIYENEFSVTLGSGKKVQVRKVTTNLFNNYDLMETEGKWISQEKIGYIKIPSFNRQKFENKALEYVKEFMNAKVIIIDIRDNRGGATPIRLTEQLMNVPYRWWSESTVMSFGLFNYYASEKRLKKKNLSKFQDSFVDGIEYMSEMLDNGSFLSVSPFEMPKEPCFKGKIIVLVNRNTMSAAEDFCMPLKVFRNATIIGERTMGSTGQPFFIKFPLNIIMYVSTKRAYYPNGGVFEGKGIEPTSIINITQKDLLSREDIILKQAVLIANNKIIEEN